VKWSWWKLTLIVVLLCTAIGFVEGTQVFLGAGAQGFSISWSSALAATMPSWYVLGLLLPPTIWIARRVRLDNDHWLRALPIHIAASIVFSMAHLAGSSFLSDYLIAPGTASMPFLQNLTRLVSIYFVLDVLYYWGFVGGWYLLDYSRRFRERERIAAELALKTSRLEASLSRANLEALRMQLNPHFLFNTLNTVSVLALKGDKHRVVRMINRLSDLLRLSLENSRQTISLREELDILERYLEIEQVRFRERLVVETSVPAALFDAEVPSLVLQPLVENAIKHGIGRQIEGGRIHIAATRLGGRLELSVHDTGAGFRKEQLGTNGTGVGLSNTAARLEQLYGSDQSLTRKNAAEGGALVVISIPFRLVPAELKQREENEWKRSAP